MVFAEHVLKIVKLALKHYLMNIVIIAFHAKKDII